MDAVAVDLQLSSGSLRVLRHGPRGGAPVVCVPGLSANARSFDAVAATLTRRGLQVAALDLRGRGFSPATPRARTAGATTPRTCSRRRGGWASAPSI
jgi:alpha-beta hydrolase superfamily lysophospholipase